MPELVTKQDLSSANREREARIDAQTLRLTVRLGLMLAAGLTVVAALQRVL
jgi:hypothetical protein